MPFSEKKKCFSPVTLKFQQITTAYFHKTVMDWKIKEERAHGNKGLAINPQTVSIEYCYQSSFEDLRLLLNSRAFILVFIRL